MKQRDSPVGTSLLDIADMMRLRLEVKDRKYRFRKFYKCFIASDAVTLMVEQELVASRQDAVILGRRLQKELNLWHHVCNDHAFKDEHLFFRFTSDDIHDDDNNNKTANDFFKDLNSSVVENDTIREGDEFLLRVADQLELGLDIGNRTHHLITHHHCFTAKEAVDYMMKQEIALSRQQAVMIGQRLEDELDFWHSVRPGQKFADENIIFRLCTGEDCAEHDHHNHSDDSDGAYSNDNNDKHALVSPRGTKRTNTLGNLFHGSPSKNNAVHNNGKPPHNRLRRGQAQRGGLKKCDDSEEIVLRCSQFDRLSAEEKAKMVLLEFGMADSSKYTGTGEYEDDSYYEE